MLFDDVDENERSVDEPTGGKDDESRRLTMLTRRDILMSSWARRYADDANDADDDDADGVPATMPICVPPVYIVELILNALR